MTTGNYYKPSSPVGNLLQSEFHQIPKVDLNNGRNPQSNNVFFPTGPLIVDVKYQIPPSPMSNGSQTTTPQAGALCSETSQINRSHSQLVRRRSVTIPDSTIPRLESHFHAGEKNSSRCWSSQSVTSKYSYANSHAFSGTPTTHCNLDNPAFAPPPRYPNTKIPLIDSSLNKNCLPEFDKITHSGHMQARTSLKALLIKKWKSAFWIMYEDNEVYLFRSKVDFEEWATNPYLSKVEREEIVKLKIDFKLGSESNLGVKGFRLFSLQSKPYGKSGQMYAFKIEQWMHYGPVVLGAFASTSQSEVGAFHTLCKEMTRRNKSSLADYMAKNHDAMNTESHRSRSNQSVCSAPTVNFR